MVGKHDAKTAPEQARKHSLVAVPCIKCRSFVESINQSVISPVIAKILIQSDLGVDGWMCIQRFDFFLYCRILNSGCSNKVCSM